MKCVIHGSGGVGGYYGGCLARAGHEVFFIARGAHLEAIQKQGLSIKSTKVDIQSKRHYELHSIHGFLVREAERISVDVPALRFIYHCLIPQENLARES